MSFRHIPVLLNEVLREMQLKQGGTYLDGTLGGGGHSLAMLQETAGAIRLFGIDRDLEALSASKERLKAYAGFTPIHGNFMDFDSLIDESVFFDGILLDLGVSSHQLDTPERGFSYHEDAPLDMRMDRSKGQSAAEYLNSVDEKSFADILYAYADEKWAARIAKVLIEKRKEKPLASTFDLVSVVDAAIPKAVRQKDTGHPARRTFQAVRIEINQELAALRDTLLRMMERMHKGGRLLVITFHSIEDRLVKQAFQKMHNPCICGPRAPICSCHKKAIGKIVKGSPFSAGEAELNENTRAHSAKLRVIERI